MIHIRDCLSGLLRRRNLGHQRSTFCLQLLDRVVRLRKPPTSQLGLLGLTVEAFLEFLAFLQRRLLRPASIHQLVRIELHRRIRLHRPPVGERQPETELEQRRDDLDRLQLRRRLRFMHCPVPRPLNLLRHRKHPAIGQRFERRLVQIRIQLILIRLGQLSVVLERPLDPRLQPPPSMNHRRPRIRQRIPLRLLRRLKHKIELGLKKRKLAHNSPRNARC